MQLVTIGCGHAGGKIVDALLERQESGRSTIADPALAVNTSRADLEGLNYIPDRYQVLIGKESVRGEGIGADNELGVELAQQNTAAVTDVLQTVQTDDADGILIIAGLGGGAGSGGAPVLAAHLAARRPEPVYSVGILPHRSEGGMYMLNAMRSLQTLHREAEAVIVFDNDAWQETENPGQTSYRRLNAKLADRLLGLFSGPHGELDALQVMTPERVQDALADAGHVSVGIASESIGSASDAGIVHRFREFLGRTGTDPPAVSDLVSQAVEAQMTLPCKMTDATQGIVVVTGPPELVETEELTAGKTWLASQLDGPVEIGVYPDPQAQRLLTTVALTGLSEAARLQALRQEARRAQRSISKLKQGESERNATIQPLF